MGAVHEKEVRLGFAPTEALDAALPFDPACNLCMEFSHQALPLHLEMIADAPQRRVLLESENFVVVPSIGALRVGHLLVLPKRHALGVLHLPQTMIDECEALVRRCAQRLLFLYHEPIVVFEHGSSPAAATERSSCIAHAHVHVLPGPSTFVAAVVGSRSFPANTWRPSESLWRMPPPYGDYLLVGMADEASELRLHMQQPSKPAPSQFFRREFAAHVGSRLHWDWRFEPSPHMFLKTMSDWWTGFDSNQER